MKTNKGILSDKELKERTRFWNKGQFRTRTKKEMNHISIAPKTFKCKKG